MAKVVFFVSRNKDNKDIPDFKERKMVMFESAKTMERFNDFVRAGKPGEFCRLYRNINERDMDRVRKSLICRLTMEDGIDLSKIERVTASIAMKPETQQNISGFSTLTAKMRINCTSS